MITICKYLVGFFFINAVLASHPSSLSMDWMDYSALPENNFFQYANGGWIAKNPVPKSESEWSAFSILDKKIEKQLRHMLEELPKNPKLYQQKINQQLYMFYKSGLDTKTIEEANIKPLQPYLTEIQQIHNNETLFATIAKLHEMSIPAFFSFSEFADIHQKNFLISQINQAALILPDRNYYLNHDTKTQQVMTHYQDFITQLFVNFGYSKESALQAYQDVLAIETHLAEISVNVAYYRSPKNIDHIQDIESIYKNYPNLNLRQYFKSIAIDDLKSVNVTVPDYFHNLNQYLPVLKSEQIKHYLIAILLVNSSPQLNKAYADPYCEFIKAIRGYHSCPARFRSVLKEENAVLGFALGDLYVSTFAKPGEVPYIQNMLKNIKHSLEIKLNHSSWLSQETTRKALKKLHKMTSRVGFPKPLDYSQLDIHSAVYVENDIAATKFDNRRHWNKINKPVTPDNWDMSPQSVNAYYDVSLNQINIPLGILQEPFFSINAPAALNYGGIGVVIGHELFHGFDDEGAQFNSDGIYQQWWTKAEWQKYEAKVTCIINQYSSYIIPHTNTHVQGKLVSGEAIADLGGVTLAYDAYTHSPYFHKAKNIDKFTPKQQFFIRFAQIWASNITPAEARRRALIDPHPPKLYRVNGTLKNVPAFYEAFGINNPQTSMCSFF